MLPRGALPRPAFRNCGQMADHQQTIVLCSCESTMPLDTDAVRRSRRGAKIETANQLCRAELERFRVAVTAGVPLTTGCTQEAPLFAQVAEEEKKQETHHNF